MRESHACRSKIVLSRIQTNFSRLTDNSDCNCLKTFEMSSEHLRNFLIMLEIGWKSFGNRWPCFEVVEKLSTPSVIFGSHREIFGSLRKSSETFSDLRKSSENFDNLRKPSVNLRNSGSVETKTLTHFTETIGRYSERLTGELFRPTRVLSRLNGVLFS